MMYALLFDKDYYSRKQLTEMSEHELLELAKFAEGIGADEAHCLEPKDFQKLFNDGCISTDKSLVFFVDSDAIVVPEVGMKFIHSSSVGTYTITKVTDDYIWHVHELDGRKDSEENVMIRKVFEKLAYKKVIVVL